MKLYGNTSDDWRDKKVEKGLGVDYFWGAGGGGMGDLVCVKEFFFQTAEDKFF